MAFLFFHRRIFAWIEGCASREYSRQVRAIWYSNWNGEEADRIAAWERTVNSLIAHNYPDEMIIEAELHLNAERVKKKLDESNEVLGMRLRKALKIQNSK